MRTSNIISTTINTAALAIIFLMTSLTLAAAEPPYDETADAKADIRAALVEAERVKVPVLVVFGANWCGDCKVLDMAFKAGMTAPLIEKNFKVVKVNVGRFDRNVDIAEGYGLPLKKGIPAVVVLSDKGSIVYSTQAGELADARSMGDKGIYDFFTKIAATR